MKTEEKIEKPSEASVLQTEATGATTPSGERATGGAAAVTPSAAPWVKEEQHGVSTKPCNGVGLCPGHPAGPSSALRIGGTRS